ncbi:MAG: BNR repeat-containing protein, partial [Muribaculaceae bacterium]|nr:BNR repeat-containing protein [Muribaculaceae bacterium]
MKKILFLLFIAVISSAIAHPATVVGEGAWCWFADPRAVRNCSPDGHTDMTYIGYIDTHGNIKATQYDFRHNTATDVLVRSCFQPDDHDSPTFLVVPDGRVMVFYSRHTDEPCFYYRISAVPGDITTLGEEHIIPTDHNTTYPSPIILADDPDHIYLCWRGINWHPTIARLSLPDADGNVEITDGPWQIVQSTGARPYAKYTSDGRSRIHLAYTTGHPDNESPNYLYYNYIDIQDMSLRDITGQKVAEIGREVFNVDKTPEFAAAHPSVIADASPYRDWVWQIATDADHRPVVAFTRISPDKKSHNYHVVRWDGSEWQKQFVAHAGGHFHQSSDIEHCYSAGMAVNPGNPSEIYCSVPVEGTHGKKYEIIRYDLDGNGEVKRTTAITSNSTANNVRPYFIPSSADSPLRLAWMQGDYFDWIVSRDRPMGYPTTIMCDFDGFTPEMFGPQTGTLPEVKLPHTFSPTEEFRISATVYPASHPDGELLQLGKLRYCVDPTTLIPEIRYGNKTFTSTNRLANSDAWTRSPRATAGQWHAPPPLKEVHIIL